MSYMRDPYYVYSTGEEVVFHDDRIEEDYFDAIALMRVAKLFHSEPERLERVIAIVRENSGNVGSWDFLEAMGDKPAEVWEQYVQKAMTID